MEPRFYKASAVALTAGAALLAGCDSKPMEVKAAPPPSAVEVYVTQKQTLPAAFEYIGQTDASQTVDVRARVTGVILEQGFTEGATVAKGDYLFRIDPRTFEADQLIADARFLQSRVDVEAAARDLKRSRQLSRSNSVSAEEVDNALTKYNISLAAQKLSEANVYKTRLELSYTTVTAPIAGRIGQAQKRPGDLVDDGEKGLLCTITQQDPIYVNFHVSEREMLEYTRDAAEGRILAPEDGNLSVSVTLLDRTPYPLGGRINFRDVKIEPQTGTALVRAQLPNPDGTLVPGQYVKVRLSGAKRPDVVLVPQRAMQHGLQGAYVYVVDEKELVEMRPVKAADWEGEQWIVESGLKVGEQVIVNGVQKARPGSAVDVTTVTRTLKGYEQPAS